MATCGNCGEPRGRKIWPFWDANDHACDGAGCQVRLCTTCHLKRPLFVIDETKASTGNDDSSNDLSRAIMKKFCQPCFETTSTVDFGRSYDVIAPRDDSRTIFVFVHGGGGSRAMFRPHADELKERYGHGSILLDLPGHATQVEKPLSLESCAETLGSVLQENSISASSTEKIIYVGGSLGAYAGFYMLDKHKDVFDAAVMIDCGQNVGPGASYKAKVGLVFLDWIGRNFSNAGMMNMMMDLAKKSPADYKLLETSFESGMFFDQCHEQIECLKGVGPADFIPSFNFPILFMNGTMDYRDSEDRWLALCTDKRSELKDYDGGDHFFSHDTRFLDDILSRMDGLAQKIK